VKGDRGAGDQEKRGQEAGKEGEGSGIPKVPGVLPEDLGGGVRRASGNPYPISDQNM